MQPERTSGSFPGVQADKKDFNCLNVDSQEKKNFVNKGYGGKFNFNGLLEGRGSNVALYMKNERNLEIKRERETETEEEGERREGERKGEGQRQREQKKKKRKQEESESEKGRQRERRERRTIKTVRGTKGKALPLKLQGFICL